MIHLNEFGVCKLASCTSYISLHKYITKICLCSNLMLHSKIPLLGNGPQREYYQTVRIGQEGSRISKMSCPQMNPCSNPIPIAHSECLASETQKVF